jgi:hypothetical protein
MHPLPVSTQETSIAPDAPTTPDAEAPVSEAPGAGADQVVSI